MESAIFGFLGVIIGAFIGILGTYLSTKATLNAEQRKTRQTYLTSRMDILAQKLADYEVWLSKYGDYDPLDKSPEAAEHALIIGQAIAACLAVGDLPKKNDTSIANLTPDKLPDMAYRSDTKIYEVHRLGYIANKRLTRNFVTKKTPDRQQEYEMWGDYHNRNRHALDHAVKRLAQLIEETSNSDTGFSVEEKSSFS